MERGREMRPLFLTIEATCISAKKKATRPASHGFFDSWRRGWDSNNSYQINLTKPMFIGKNCDENSIKINSHSTWFNLNKTQNVTSHVTLNRREWMLWTISTFGFSLLMAYCCCSNLKVLLFYIGLSCSTCQVKERLVRIAVPTSQGTHNTYI